MERPLTIAPKQLTPEEEVEWAASMARHPAGKKRLPATCPTCGTNPSGVIGDPELMLR